MVMKAKALSEDEAYALMRKAAMNGNKRIGDVARSIITSADLLL
jgi:response regulator NasT